MSYDKDLSSYLMECGHIANAWGFRADATERQPVCVICHCFAVMNALPNLDGRRARCDYYGRVLHKNECRECSGKVKCECEVPSSTKLAFFGSKPDEPYDSYYCGCHSWD